MEEPKRTLPNYIGFLIVILVGLPFFGFGFLLFYEDYVPATGWELAQGTITFSTLDEEYDYDSDIMIYYPDIAYAYDYEGEKYHGRCCDFGTSDAGAMQRMVDNHPVGGPVELLVNPDDPYQSRINEDVNPYDILNLILLAVGGLIMLFGIFGLLVELKKKVFG